MNRPPFLPRVVPALVLAPVLLAATACGDDPAKDEGTSDPRSTAITALATRLGQDAAPQGGADPVLSKDETTCIATALVDDLGLDALVDAGVLTADHTTAQVPEIPSKAFTAGTTVAISDCVGVVTYTVRLTRALGQTAKATNPKYKFDDSDEYWDRVLTCATGKIKEKNARRAALKAGSNGVLPDRLLKQLNACDPGAS